MRSTQVRFRSNRRLVKSHGSEGCKRSGKRTSRSDKLRRKQARRSVSKGRSSRSSNNSRSSRGRRRKENISTYLQSGMKWLEKVGNFGFVFNVNVLIGYGFISLGINVHRF